MRLLFEEKQRFDQWLRVVMVSTALIVIGIFVNGMYVQLILKQPWGNKPMSDDMLVTIAMLMICGLGAMLYIFFVSELEITIDKGGLSYRYFPVLRSWRRIEKESIKDFELNTWILRNRGYRINVFGNRTIIMKGKQGVKVHMQNGKWVLLGTQKPEEFMAALHTLKNRNDD